MAKLAERAAPAEPLDLSIREGVTPADRNDLHVNAGDTLCLIGIGAAFPRVQEKASLAPLVRGDLIELDRRTRRRERASCAFLGQIVPNVAIQPINSANA